MEVTKTATCTSLHAGRSSKTPTEYGWQCAQRRPNQTTELLSDGHCFAKNNTPFATTLRDSQGSSLLIISAFRLTPKPKIRGWVACGKPFSPSSSTAKTA